MTFEWKEFNPQAKIWVYQSDRKLSPPEIDQMLPLISSFCARWTAHDKALNAKGEILYSRFLVLAVDESQNPATGCSIDKSVHFLKELQAEFNLNWFNRLFQAYIHEGNEVRTFQLSALNDLLDEQKLTADTIIFDNSIQKLWQLEKEWKKPLSQSWLANKYDRWKKSKQVIS